MSLRIGTEAGEDEVQVWPEQLLCGRGRGSDPRGLLPRGNSQTRQPGVGANSIEMSYPLKGMILKTMFLNADVAVLIRF